MISSWLIFPDWILSLDSSIRIDFFYVLFVIYFVTTVSDWLIFVCLLFVYALLFYVQDTSLLFIAHFDFSKSFYLVLSDYLFIIFFLSIIYAFFFDSFIFILTFSCLFLIKHIRAAAFCFNTFFHVFIPIVFCFVVFFVCLFVCCCFFSVMRALFKCLISDDNSWLKIFVWPHLHVRQFAGIRTDFVIMLTIALSRVKTNLLRSHWSKKRNSTVNTLISCFWLVSFFFHSILIGWYYFSIFLSFYLCALARVCVQMFVLLSFSKLSLL